MSTALSGLASGFDWQTLITQLADVERAPQRQLQSDQTKIQERNNAFGSLKTELKVLRNRIADLKTASFFDSRTATSSDTTKGKVSASAGAPVGHYTFAITQLATASQQVGANGAGKQLSATDDVTALSLSSAGFASAVTAGTFTVNGKQVTVESTDTLGGVFAKIATATGNAVTAAYSSATDKITFSSSSAIVLGSATDTSNFLQAAKLNGNNATSITSDGELGSIRLTSALAGANFGTAVTGGAAGEFKVNGISIKFDATQDSVASVLDRINTSSAGVLASYDVVNDRFTLTNKNTGSVGIALEDVSGNFLAASGLSGGTVSLGKNLLYSVNGGGTLTSQSNTITGASSGLDGLSVTALAESSFSVDVALDTDKIKTAVSGFVSAYNSVQSLIASKTASSTDAKGKVTAGILANDTAATSLTSQLRALATGSITALTGGVKRLDSIGIASNGYDDSLSASAISKLDSMLTTDPGAVKDFFANATDGLAVKFDSFLEATIGDDGSITTHQDLLTKQSLAIDDQVADQEKLVQAEIERLTASFVAMEQAQAQSNQQLQYLTKSFG